MTTPQDPNRPTGSDPWAGGAGQPYQGAEPAQPYPGAQPAQPYWGAQPAQPYSGAQPTQPYPGGQPYSAGQPYSGAQPGYPPGQQPYPGQAQSPGQQYPGQAAYPGATGGYQAPPGYPASYPGAPATLPPKPAVPGSVNGSFWIFVVAAVWTVLSVVLVVNSSIWDQALAYARANGAITTDVDSVIGIVKTTVIAFAVVFAALYVFFAFKMRAGRNWARITLTVLAALSLVQAFGYRGTVTVGDQTYVASHLWQGILAAALSLIAIILMWVKPSNDYFAAMKARRYIG